MGQKYLDEATGEWREATEDDVVVGNKIVGSDPDANVRDQIRRDRGAEAPGAGGE